MEFLVDYIDTDAMAIVHHASYFRWLERARVEWLRSMGLCYKEMEAEGYYLPLRGASIQYLKTLKFDDRPAVEVSVDRIRMAGVDIHYRIVLNGEVATTAHTSHVLCTREVTDGIIIWSPAKVPEKWRKIWLEQIEKK